VNGKPREPLDFVAIHRGTAPQGGHPDALVAGIQGSRARGLPVQPILPPLPPVEGTNRSGHAPGAPGRGDPVCRLGRDDGGHFSIPYPEKFNPPRFLSRSWRPPATPTLRPPPLSSCLTGSAPTVGPLPSLTGSASFWFPTTRRPASQGLLLRARHQSQLPGYGPSLWHRYSSDAGQKTSGQGLGEGAVLLVERWILARIRNETFFSLSELNRRLRELIEDLNGRSFQKLPVRGVRPLRTSTGRPSNRCPHSPTSSPNGKRRP